ncbi:MAG TPA: HD-GYP domain-containing protein [Rectinemataceae bacterium]|nr:HD-GYP domain-containing protein [Rectinemataceae bacterium]
MGELMNAILLKDLSAKLFFSRPLFLDEGYVLLAPETPVDEALIKRLIRWEFRELRSEGVPMAAEAKTEGADKEGEIEAVLHFADSAGDRERLQGIAAFYEDFTSYVEALYTRFVTTTQLDYKELTERMKGMLGVINENRRFVLRAQSQMPQNKNYLVSHAVRSSIFSIILGIALKLPPFRLIELGAAAILHEIGMIRLPPQLYMADRQLSAQERKSITTHPVLGYNLLKERQVPLAVCLAALEHHERLNGTGYPRLLTGDKISLYSRIIMVACSYDAVTALRPWKEAKDGYAGMVDLLKNEGKQYDDTVIRALVYSLSIYPIGTYVLLTNGKAALVVDVDPENPRYPIVQVLGARSPDGKDLTIKTGETSVRVLRPMSREEIDRSRNLGK